MKISRGKIWTLLFLLLAGGGAGFYFGYYRPLQKAKAAAAAQKLALDGGDMDRTYKVRRDDLIIGLQQGGYVNASKKHKLSLQANYRTSLLWVIDENSKVKAGDLLAKFETDGLLEQIENHEIELDNLRKEYDLAIETEKILLSTNAAELQQAQEGLSQADDALRKYRRFERVSTRDSLDLAISDAEEALETEENNYNSIRDSEIKVSNDENADEKKRQELQTAQSKIDKAEKNLETAKDNRKVFRRYDHPSKMTRLTNALEQAKLNLRKVKISTESKLVQQKKSIENYRRRIKRTGDQLKRYKDYMTMMELRAPVDGVVIYADPDRRWGNLDVKPGIDINKGQVLITIPEMSNLVVDFDLPEQYRSKISVGDRVIITPDSIQTIKMNGHIKRIAQLPVNLIPWDQNSPKIYRTVVDFSGNDPRVVSGMSVQVEVVSRILKDVLYIPIEAVFEENGKLLVYRKTLGGPEKVFIKIGESNNNFVEVAEGLEEGDDVFLYRPFQGGK